MDRAIVAGLAALGLPRGPVRDVRIEAAGRGWSGRKLADCAIVLDGLVMEQNVLVLGRPDAVFRTWLHESLHGRQPYAPDAQREYGPFRGYEEGLAEGLARRLVETEAGMGAGEMSYDFYVASYRVLARVLDLDVEQVWRALWQHPAGRVRAALGDVLDGLRRDSTGLAPTRLQRQRLLAVADRLFRSKRSGGFARRTCAGAVVEVRIAMTPEQFVHQVRKLIRARKDREALAFAERFWPLVLPQLSADQLDRISGMMEGAQMAVDLEETSISAPTAER